MNDNIEIILAALIGKVLNETALCIESSYSCAIGIDRVRRYAIEARESLEKVGKEAVSND